MLPEPDPIPRETLRRLHRQAVSGQGAVRVLLERLLSAHGNLAAGIDRHSEERIVKLVGLRPDALLIRADGDTGLQGRQLALSFDLGDASHFFTGFVRSKDESGICEIAWPEAIYLREKRELHRAAPGRVDWAPSKVSVANVGGAPVLGQVVDWSYHGMGVDVPADAAKALDRHIQINAIDGRDAGVNAWGEVRHRAAKGEWTRLGLSVSRVPSRPRLPLEPLGDLPDSEDSADTSQCQSAMTERVVFQNEHGEPIRGIIDRWGEPRGATSVVIPPAWGRTKETLLPLALSIVESFRAAGKPVVVLRFDGTRRRGESFRPAGGGAEGAEHFDFTFSQAVEDTQAAIQFVRDRDGYSTARAVLLTFSMAAVEGRRTLALDQGRNVQGWVSVVGVGDLATALHRISGGVDYGYGLLRGLRFGLQELFGVVVDIDRAGTDAIQKGLAFFEDARRDMEVINVPVTWVLGRDDAWVDRDRVQDLLACGPRGLRRLVEIPTGHQLRSSKEALRAFGWVASEVGRMAAVGSINPKLPDAKRFRQQRAIERRRLVRPGGSLQPFWRDYLMGRGGRVGIELLTATDAYRELMEAQKKLLALESGERVVDLGSGTGDFAVSIEAELAVEIIALDFVREALRRGRDRFEARHGGSGPRAVAADLEIGIGASSLPLAAESCDAVLASLLLGYVEDPAALLAEVARILRPGGRLVISSLRKDADFSRLYSESLAERYSSRPREVFGADGERDVDDSLPYFLNAAARILDLEERGRFRFFEADELKCLLEQAGFKGCDVETALGDPPQAIVVKGIRR